MDAKEEPPWMGSRRAPAKLYGAFSRRMLKSCLCQNWSLIFSKSTKISFNTTSYSSALLKYAINALLSATF